jgi:hypothetical protein
MEPCCKTRDINYKTTFGMKKYFKNPAILLLFGIVLIMAGCSKGPNYEIYKYPTQAASGISPVSGYPKTLVTISGKNFGTLTNAVKVSFGGVSGAVVSCADNQIVVQVPANGLSGKVLLSVWTVTDSVGNFTIVPAPVITTQSTTAASPGDTLNLTGSGFGTNAAALTVNFNGVAGSVYSVTADTLVRVIVPAGFTSGPDSLYVNGYAVAFPTDVAYLVSVPDPIYQLDFEGNLNATIGANATYIQGTGSALTYVPGVSGQAVYLAGMLNPDNSSTNQAIALQPNNVAQLNEFTASTWVNTPGQVGDWSGLYNFGDGRYNKVSLYAQTAGWWNGAGNNMVGRFMDYNVAGGGETNDITSASIPTSGWHHLVMTVSKTNLRMIVYLDGTAIGTQTLPGRFDVLTEFNAANVVSYLGASVFIDKGEACFKGAIDKFQLWNSELTASQVYTVFYKK